MTNFKRGDEVFLIENGRIITPVKILNCVGGLYTIQFLKKSGATRVKAHRLFRTEQEAKKNLGILDRPRYNPLNYE